MQGIDICQKEGFYGDVSSQMQSHEGCNMYGHLDIPKVAGNIHFAPGHGIQQSYMHVHDLVSFTIDLFNISHTINALSFGEFIPNSHEPLKGVMRTVLHGSGMQQYFIKLVPAVFISLSGNVVHSYRYSVTEHLKNIDPRVLTSENSNGILPGVFFNYEISPMRVRIVEQRKSNFLHFLTRIFAIIGGLFTVMGSFDKVLEGAMNYYSKKSQKGSLI
jgi:hypothetical protein